MMNLYRSTSDSDLLRRVQNDLKLVFPGARRFQPTEAFIATWNEVGYYEEKSNKVKPNYCKKVFVFLIHLFARGILAIKKLEIKKNGPTFSVLKVE